MQVAGDGPGRDGESLVSAYLSGNGFSIIARNFNIRGGEIDIVALKGPLMCFVEVKTRRSLRRGRGALSVGRAKMSRIAKAARVFIARNRGRASRYRFDVAEVEWTEGEAPRINYIENAFQPGDKEF